MKYSLQLDAINNNIPYKHAHSTCSVAYHYSIRSIFFYIKVTFTFISDAIKISTFAFIFLVFIKHGNYYFTQRLGALRPLCGCG